MHDSRQKLVIIIPAYNAAKTIQTVFERVPLEIWGKHVAVIIVNDGSTDETREKIQEIQRNLGNVVTVIDKIKNEGYARAQKDGFSLALVSGADMVAVLHADGQYAPEVMPELLRPLEDRSADIVQGSRMMDKREALRGGMPLYKFIGNIVLSNLENWAYGLHFAEYHSGYMLYSRKALLAIPFQKLSNTFHFDGEMLFMGSKMGFVAKEIPIPTSYGDEVSRVRPILYGFQVIGIMKNYILGKYNF